MYTVHKTQGRADKTAQNVKQRIYKTSLPNCIKSILLYTHTQQCLDYQPQVLTQGGGRVWQCCGCGGYYTSGIISTVYWYYTRYLDVKKWKIWNSWSGWFVQSFRRAIVRAINIIQKESGIEYVCAGNVWQSGTLGSWCVAIWGSLAVCGREASRASICLPHCAWLPYFTPAQPRVWLSLHVLAYFLPISSGSEKYTTCTCQEDLATIHANLKLYNALYTT